MTQATDVQLVSVDPPSPYLCSASSPSRYLFDSRKGSFTGVSDTASIFGRPNQEGDRFYGEWRDSLGHYIYVTDAPGGFAGQKFSAILSRPNTIEKTLTIRRNLRDGEDRWICGNGYLDGSQSNSDFLVWETEDGRISEWKRVPPNGPVFFDPPPYLVQQVAVERRRRTRSGLEKIVPSLIETSHLCHVDETTGLLVWRLQDEWEKLKNFPTNCCITSPKFTSELGGSEVMQVVFYPTGLYAEKSSSVLSLTRDSVDWCNVAGLKVEFFINDISLGKRVFHNYRTDLEVAHPSDDTVDVIISVALHKK